MTTPSIVKITLVLVAITLIASKTAEEWKTRSVYQLMTDRFARSDDKDSKPCILNEYCGGTYNGILNHLDYIQDMGFNAIWISPIIENVPGSYHGYGFSNLYKLNENYGDEESLRKLIEECHKRDIWIMVDVVANHCGIVDEDYSRITPFNDPKYYHEECQIGDNWGNQTIVENCRLCNLPDLKQEDDYVKQTLLDWIHDLVKNYEIDGLRVDTVVEVPKWFWNEFTPAAGVFTLGEVFNGNIEYVGGYQGPLDALFNYPLYFKMNNGYCNDLKQIEEYYVNERKRFKDATIFGLFLENHDNPRFLNSCGNDIAKFRNAIVFSIVWEGIPVFYYGGEQYFNGGRDPENREPMWGHFDKTSLGYDLITKLNKLRTEYKMWTLDVVQRYADEEFYAFTRGKHILVCTSTGKKVTRDITYHEWTESTKLCNWLNPSDCVKVKDNKITIELDKEPKIYVIDKKASYIH